MKKGYGIKIGISLTILCLMAIHCADPNTPRINILSPAMNAILVSDTVPGVVDVELSVPVPGCGGTGPAVNPDSFTAELIRSQDGVEISTSDVTSDFTYVLDTATGAYAYTAEVSLADFGDYDLYFTIQNVSGLMGANLVSLRLEQTVSEFPGGNYSMSVSSLGQVPDSCLLPSYLVGLVLPIIRGVPFALTLPSGQAILDSGNAYPLAINVPLVGNIDVTLSLDDINNDILLDGPDEYTIDLSTLGVPIAGFDCIITASADGVFNDMDPNDPDGSLTVGIIDIQPSPVGSCTLSAPAGDCDLVVGMDGNLL